MPKIVFGECLKLLLSTLDISNSRLSKAINVDSSLVSRWIHGKRVPPYNSSYIESISDYLSSNIHNTLQEQQINEIFQNACLEEEITDGNKEKIKKILLEAQGYSIEGNKKKRIEVNHVRSYKNQIRKNIHTDPANPMDQNIASFIALSSEDRVVLGVDNVLAAYNELLDTAAMQGNRKDKAIYITHNSLLNLDHLSNHDITKWYSALLKVINNGWNVILLLKMNANTIRTVRFINYMILLVQTGKFMPFYIKNYDSMIIGDELIVVPDIGAFSCFSDHLQPYINCGLYIKSKPVIKIYQNHFQGILAKYAQPLINNFPNRTAYSHYLADCEDDIGNRFLYKYCFSVLTLPEHLYWKYLGSRSDSKDSNNVSIELFRKRMQAFQSNIQRYEYKDVYMVSSIKNLMRNYQFYLHSYEGIQSIHMDTDDIIEYLENIIELLRTYENYQIAFLPKDFDSKDYMESFCCIVKERAVVLFEASDQSMDTQEVLSSISEPTIVQLIYNNFMNLWELIPPINKEKSAVISWLQCQINILKQLNCKSR